MITLKQTVDHEKKILYELKQEFEIRKKFKILIEHKFDGVSIENDKFSTRYYDDYDRFFLNNERVRALEANIETKERFIKEHEARAEAEQKYINESLKQFESLSDLLKRAEILADNMQSIALVKQISAKYSTGDIKTNEQKIQAVQLLNNIISKRK